jgi:hypothetical protein
MSKSRNDKLQDVLTLLVLRTLETRGPLQLAHQSPARGADGQTHAIPSTPDSSRRGRIHPLNCGVLMKATSARLNFHPGTVAVELGQQSPAYGLCAPAHC